MTRKNGEGERRLRITLSYATLSRAVTFLLTVALCVMTCVLVFQTIERWYYPLAFGLALIVNFICKHRLNLEYRWLAFLYAVDFVLLLAMTYFVGDGLISTLYFLILSDFYFGSAQLIGSLVMTVISFASYFLCLFLCGALPPSTSDLLTFIFNQLIMFALVFVVVNLLVAVARKNDVIEKSLKEITQREEKLREAYKSLEEVTILEERNRIAKRIHDTTGHALTTIIMQTEAAKLIIDRDPADAKRKIISANMQATNALEEMRKSVRLLSGEEENFDLIAAIERTVVETMEGTGVVIRSKVDPAVETDAELGRFIYSTLKEGLNNGIRHGASTAFFFDLELREDYLFFLLSDNGRGAKKIDPGFGLSTMRRKAEEMGGTVRFRSSEGEGFDIEIRLPYPQGETKEEQE